MDVILWRLLTCVPCRMEWTYLFCYVLCQCAHSRFTSVEEPIASNSCLVQGVATVSPEVENCMVVINAADTEVRAQ